MSGYHTPVLLEESLQALISNPSGIYADATFGGGGHTAGILSRLQEDGHVIAFDRDSDALENRIDDPRLTLVHGDFRFIRNYALEIAHAAAGAEEEETGRQTEGNRAIAGAEKAGSEATAAGTEEAGSGTTAAGTEETGSESAAKAEAARSGATAAGTEEAGSKAAVGLRGWDGKFDGILADLGVSSHQFDTAERGFSFRYDAPLDMRMNREGGKTAEEVVNTYSREELEKVLWMYGEVENARKVAQLIAAAREKGRIGTTGELDEAVAPALPKTAEHKALAKIYQALRIEVNHEMRSLEKFLEGAVDSLKEGGRLVVITYHSLEDRMVKNFIKAGNPEGKEEKDFYGNIHAPLRAVNRKPVVPQESEVAGNTRARSAKLRVAEKTGAAKVHDAAAEKTGATARTGAAERSAGRDMPGTKRIEGRDMPGTKRMEGRDMQKTERMMEGRDQTE